MQLVMKLQILVILREYFRTIEMNEIRNKKIDFEYLIAMDAYVRPMEMQLVMKKLQIIVLLGEYI